MVSLLGLLACLPDPEADARDGDSGPAADTAPDDSADTDDSADVDDTALDDPCLSRAPDDPCCVESADYLQACADFDRSLTLTGTFTPGSDTEDWILTTTDGAVHNVYLDGRGIGPDLRPDLATLGEVTVTATGCDLDGESAVLGTFEVLGGDGQLLFALGTVDAMDAGGIALSTDPTGDTCPDRPPGPDAMDTARCFETVRNYPLEFTDGTTTLTLYQGESGELAHAQVTVLLSMIHGEPTFRCSDVSGNLTNWVIVGALPTALN